MGFTLPSVLLGAAAGTLAAVGVYTAVVPTSAPGPLRAPSGVLVADVPDESPPVVVTVAAEPTAATCDAGSAPEAGGCVVTVLHAAPPAAPPAAPGPRTAATGTRTTAVAAPAPAPVPRRAGAPGPNASPTSGDDRSTASDPRDDHEDHDDGGEEPEDEDHEDEGDGSGAHDEGADDAHD